MNAGVTSERVYDALKAYLLNGDTRPGERLEPGAFAERLASSVTPVRDALHRLAGEYIVEMRAAEGFQLPLVTEPGLRGLLGWNAELLRLALRRWPTGPAPGMKLPVAADYASEIRALFATMAERSKAAEIVRQVDAASDRLAAARVAEARVIPGIQDELQGLKAAIAANDPRMITRHLSAYHRRRAALVPAIVEAMYRRGGEGHL